MNRLRFLLLMLACVVVKLEIQGSLGLDRWHVIHEYPPTDFKHILFAKDKFVAATWQGSIATSTDGISWTHQYHDRSKLINGMTFGNNHFVVVGRDLNAGRFVLTSADGEAWTSRNMPPEEFHGITFGHGRFVAVSSRQIYASEDGETWSAVGHQTNYSYQKISFANNRFIVEGSVFSLSTDGVNWTVPVRRNSIVDSIAYGSGIYVGTGQQGIYTSTDGMTWALRSDVQQADFLRQVVFANGFFLAVGAEARTGKGRILTSLDGRNWTSQLTSAPLNDLPNLEGAAYGSGVYVVIGPNIVLASTNGIDWAEAPGMFAKEFSSVASRNGLIAAAGQERSRLRVRSLIATSTTGLHWTQREVPNISSLTSIAHGNRVFAARSSQGLLRSTDGVQWVAHELPDHFGTTISFVNDRFFLCGKGGAISTSDDGLSWTQHPTGITEEIRAVAYGYGRYVAVGGILFPEPSKDVILTSTDGHNWEKLPFSSGNMLRSVAFGNGQFVAMRWVGLPLISTNGLDWEPGSAIFRQFGPDKIIYRRASFFTWDSFHHKLWSSIDGRSWQEYGAPMALPWSPNDYAFAGDQLIAVGVGTIWRSAPVLAPFIVSAAADDEIFMLNVGNTQPRTFDLEVRYVMEVTGIEGQISSETNSIRIPIGKQTVYLEPPSHRFTQARLTLLPDPSYEVASPNSAILTPVNPGAAPRFRRVGTAKLSTSEMQIHLEAPAGSNILVESSTNLSDWTAVRTHTNVSDNLLLKMPIQINAGGRYYRARILAD